ncbi:MAG TPA: hypothetical protein DER23_01925 [Clostridiales bacterium]|jgi:hypothetical protein|nr:hypothetical protein [Clostridiales bacterium]
MFHVLLVLPVILIMMVIAAVVLFGIVAIVAACIGGTSVAILIKNTLVKKLLFVGFGVLLCVGVLCIIPVISFYLDLTTIFFSAASGVVYFCMTLLAIWGIRVSCTVSSKLGKTLLIVAFCLVLIAAISLAIFTVLANILL